jgi:hypothetical protein
MKPPRASSVTSKTGYHASTGSTLPPSHRLSKAGIRKMIARLHEELAVYEGSQEVNSAK